MSESTSVGLDMPNQIERCRELVRVYESLHGGHVNCSLAIAMTNRAIKEGVEALASQDPVRIVRAYAALKECE